MASFIEYVGRRFNKASEVQIERANSILDEYEGLDLTLRQLYYQFVARGYIPNNQKEYNKLKELIDAARLAGRIDWERLEDRTRATESYEDWESPGDAFRSAAWRYREPRWDNQPYHVEVWVEKDALVGVIEDACQKYNMPFLSCRGYCSQSEMWRSAQRLAAIDKDCIILHLGDHDPSGIDMTRDIQARMDLFEAYNVTVNRIGLNMDQIIERRPPPNPVKFTDCRANGYVKQFGKESWELDALDPTYMVALIHSHTEVYMDLAQWEKDTVAMEDNRQRMLRIASNTDLAYDFLHDPKAIQLFHKYTSRKKKK